MEGNRDAYNPLTLSPGLLEDPGGATSLRSWLGIKDSKDQTSLYTAGKWQRRNTRRQNWLLIMMGLVEAVGNRRHSRVSLGEVYIA